MEVYFHKKCAQEVSEFPESVQKDLYEIIEKLKNGLWPSMPVARKLHTIGKGVFELRLRDKDGIYRVIYIILETRDVFLVHAFQKKSQKTPLKSLRLAKKRMED